MACGAAGTGEGKADDAVEGWGSVNDDKGLEHEADVMGGRAGNIAYTRKLQAILYSCPPKSSVVIAPLQRLRIAILNLETKTATGPELVNALDGIMEPLENVLGDFEARAILSRFDELEFSPPENLEIRLKKAADFWHHDKDDDDVTKKGKKNLAEEIVSIAGSVMPLMLSGGGAVTLRGSSRDIKDLDFRTVLQPDITFRTDDIVGSRLVEKVNTELALGHYVQPLEVQDMDTGYTIKGEVDSVEVSITRTPLVRYDERVTFAEGVRVLSDFDLLMDKAYSFIFRREFDKKISDLYDLAFILNKDGNEGRDNARIILRELANRRGKAYDRQASKHTARSGAKLEAIVDELTYRLEDIMLNKVNYKPMEKKFRELKSEYLIKVLQNFLNVLSPVGE